MALIPVWWKILIFDRAIYEEEKEDSGMRFKFLIYFEASVWGMDWMQMLLCDCAKKLQIKIEILRK